VSQLFEKSIATEAAILSSWFFEPKFRQAYKPDPNSFSLVGYQAIAEVIHDKSPADADMLVLELKRRGKLSLFDGGAQDVFDLINSTPAVVDPWKEVDRLRELNGIRMIRSAMQASLRELDAGNLSLGDTQARLSDALRASSSQSGAQVRTTKQLLQTSLDRALEPRNLKSRCFTGIGPLDNAMGGHRPGHIMVFGAPTNWGKSSFLCYDADYLLQTGHRVCIISGEDEESIYADRLMCLRTKANAWRLREGKLTPEEQSVAKRVVNEADNKPLFIDGIGKSAEQLASAIRSIAATERIEVFFVDYVQVFQTEKKCEDRRNEVKHIYRVFADAIKQSNASGVVFSQLTEDPKGGQLTKNNLRDCRDLAHAAEEVVIGFNKDGKKCLLVDKIKDGPKNFLVPMLWDCESACFLPQETDEQRYSRQFDEIAGDFEAGGSDPF
jgi:replicative DNA helicase